jgi:hypothetical protein
MNWAGLERKLIGAARKHPPSERIPYAFEQRVMARLKSSDRRDEWEWWNRAFWVGASACAAVALATSIWSFQPDDADAAGSFSHGFEQSLFAAADEVENAW